MVCIYLSDSYTRGATKCHSEVEGEEEVALEVVEDVEGEVDSPSKTMDHQSTY